MNMSRDIIKKMIPYLGICALAFYGLPLWGQDTGSFMLILLILIPLVSFLAALVYGLKNGFHLLYPVLVGAVFAPTIYLYYNETAWVYILGYALIALAGNRLGWILERNLPNAR